MLSLILVIVLISFSSANDPCPKFTPPTGPFNLESYLGVWYEMARIETPFELGIDCANATYTPKETGRIGITNAGKYLKSGMVASVTGEGLQTEQVNVLKVRLIAGEPEANYWIVETDFTSYALVCSCTTLPIGTFKGAWVLSRNKTMEKSRYDYLTAKLPALGIKISDLRKTEQLASS